MAKLETLLSQLSVSIVDGRAPILKVHLTVKRPHNMKKNDFRQHIKKVLAEHNIEPHDIKVSNSPPQKDTQVLTLLFKLDSQLTPQAIRFI
jgi:hypothetical protein